LKNISSHTAKNSLYPEYIIINENEAGVSIQARAPEHVTSSGTIQPGEIIEILMTEEQFKRFIDQAVEGFKPSVDPRQMDLLV